jgi:hypothetical protein
MVRPGRHVVEEPGESSSGTTGAQTTQEAETLADQRLILEAERKLLLERLEVQKLEEEIRLLRQNATGQRGPSILDSPVVESTPGTPSHVGTKRPHDDDGDDDLLDSPETACRRIVVRSQLRIQEPEKYDSQNLRRYREFIRHCKVAHQLQPDEYPMDCTKLLHASLSLEGETLDAWLRYEKDNGMVTWEDFKQMLRNLLQDPVTRALMQGLWYDRAVQRQRQTVQQFVNYLDEIEAELEPYSDEHRKQHLLAKLRPELRRALGNYQELPATRTQVINLAIQLEANME